MAFSMILYFNKSPKNQVSKELEEMVALEGTFKGGESLTDPVVYVEDKDAIVPTVNYAYISAFSRYYFIVSAKIIRTGLFELTLHVDVLHTYAEGIKALDGIIRRNRDKYNLYLNDGVFKVYQNPRVQTLDFPGGFTQQEFVLLVAGGGGNTQISGSGGDELEPDKE